MKLIKYFFIFLLAFVVILLLHSLVLLDSWMILISIASVIFFFLLFYLFFPLFIDLLTTKGTIFENEAAKGFIKNIEDKLKKKKQRTEYVLYLAFGLPYLFVIFVFLIVFLVLVTTIGLLGNSGYLSSQAIGWFIYIFFSVIFTIRLLSQQKPTVSKDKFNNMLVSVVFFFLSLMVVGILGVVISSVSVLNFGQNLIANVRLSLSLKHFGTATIIILIWFTGEYLIHKMRQYHFLLK